MTDGLIPANINQQLHHGLSLRRVWPGVWSVFAVTLAGLHLVLSRRTLPPRRGTPTVGVASSLHVQRK